MVKVGTILIAIDECVMEDSNEKTLTVGKEYEVRSCKEPTPYDLRTTFGVIDDIGDTHWFDVQCIHEFFKIKS